MLLFLYLLLLAEPTQSVFSGLPGLSGLSQWSDCGHSVGLFSSSVSGQSQSPANLPHGICLFSAKWHWSSCSIDVPCLMYISFSLAFVGPDCARVVLLMEELRLMPSWHSSWQHRALVRA